MLTLENLQKKYEKFPLLIHPMMNGQILVTFYATDIETMNIESDEKVFEVSSYDDADKKIEEWIENPFNWVDANLRLFYNLTKTELHKIGNYQDKIFKLGFKTVSVDFVASNFVEVVAWYCYRDKNGKVKVDGRLHVNRIGNAEKTYEYCKNFVESRQPYFIPSNVKK